MAKPGRKPKHVDLNRLLGLAALGLNTNELAAVSGLSRGRFFVWLRQGDRRQQIADARANAEHVARTLDLIGKLAMSGRPATAIQYLHRLTGPKAKPKPCI